MRLFAVYLTLAGAVLLVGVLGSETVILLAICGVLALIVGMVVVAWPPRPPRHVNVYRKDDLDWPDQMVLEGQWMPISAGLLEEPVPDMKGGV